MLEGTVSEPSNSFIGFRYRIDQIFAFSFLGSKRIKIYKSSPTQSNLKLKPGVIEISETGELLVGCKNHTVLKIDEIQIEGKKVVSSKEFIQGYKALIQREIKFSGNAR